MVTALPYNTAELTKLDGGDCFACGCPHLAAWRVTFGRLGNDGDWPPLWRESWGQSYAMCAGHWDDARTFLSGRIGLTVNERPAPQDEHFPQA